MSGDGPDIVGATWRPVDLGPYLAGTVSRPEPVVGLARSDGLRLLYPGKEHTVIGEMESGKSWFAIASVAAELHQGHRVVYVHFEEADPIDTIERLRSLGATDDLIVERFAFVGPNEPADPWALAALLDPAPSLVVLDGVNEAMSLHQQGIRDEDGVAAFRRLLVKPCTAVGAAVLSCDHVVKDREKRGRDALGSIHKGNGLTGSLILLENAAPFGRGERGCSHVFVTKDRPGWLRRNGRPERTTPGKTYMGSLIVDDTRTMVGYLDVAFVEPRERAEPTEAAKTRDEADDERILAVVADMAQAAATVRAVRARSGISKERTTDALTRLALDHKLTETTGPRNSRIYNLPDVSPTGLSGPVPIEGGPGPVHSLTGPGTSEDRSGPVTERWADAT